MSSNHNFEGKTLALLGRFSNTRAGFSKELEALGARTTKSVSSKTDYVIVGKQTLGGGGVHASMVGAIVLSEQEARAVMRGEQIETPSLNAGGEQSIDELLGEARSVLAMPPSPHTWRALTLLFDVCAVEHHATLTEYIQAHTSTWSASHMHGQHGREVLEEDLERHKDDRDRSLTEWMARERCDIFRGELRVAPQWWKGELFQGVDSPKFELVRAISLDTNSRAIAKALSSPHLINLTHLDLRAQISPTLQLARAFCKFAWLPRLTHLALGSINLKTANHFREHADSGSLTTLDLSETYYADHNKDGEVHDAFVGTPLFETIESLWINHVTDRTLDLITRIVDQQAFSRLHTIYLTQDSRLSSSGVSRLAHTGVLDRVSTLGLGEFVLTPEVVDGSWQGLWRTPLPATVSMLDASRLAMSPDLSDQDFARATKLMTEGDMMRHIAQIRLGEWLDEPRLIEPLAQLRPDITLTR